jgi:hypothetical protein
MKIGVHYIGVSAGAVIINNESKYFLAKRESGARDDIGKWEFLGGTIKFYETGKKLRSVIFLKSMSLKYESKKHLAYTM